MKPSDSPFYHLPARLQRYLRSRLTSQRQQQREQWLDDLAAATPDDDELINREREAERRARILGGIRARTQPSARVLPLWPVLRVAAVLVPLLLAGALLWPRLRPAPSMLRYATGVGQHREVVLPDRSHVWLRPGSELTCAATFGTVRTVQLRGEAFFDVTKDPKHPFVVHTGKVTVQVLGTSFLVKAYAPLPTTMVLVRTGRVQVAHQQRILGVLRPYDQLLYNTRTQQLTRSKNEYADAMPTSRLLTFEQASLPEILLLLENNYPIHVELGRDAPTVALTGTLDPSLSADQITDVLNVLLQRHHLRITKRSASTYQVQ
ncbi:FecR family protein [Hymenobacter cellulosivorans]|uniref:FecR domain-containing protein n=1 Tax=Hymenobacter cellulosivorans TaxID=2932249 RepID=A0ABY4F7U8_9BACT|nr:FecR domain-containing protein [Hymenobacter cellulosivorans]UOQ52276.1 FecR domain-containing protein [Hymenobacter cellulosivorans]